MRIGIVGLPKSGKTTIFNAVTRGSAETAAYSTAQGNPNIGVAKVPDHRLEVLEGLFKSRRRVHAEVTYVDIPAATEAFGKSLGVSGDVLNHVQRADGLMVVARAFEDASVPHVADSIEPFRDVGTALYELAFADLEILDRRLARVQQGFKGAKATERDALNKEQALLERLKAGAEAGTPIRDQDRSQDEKRLLEGFQLLTAKPAIVVMNIGESQLSDIAPLETKLSSVLEGPRVRGAVLCGQLEMELAQMDPGEEQEFRDSLEVGDSGLDRMIGLSHEVLDQITFFTGNTNEVRAWNVTRGTPALQAAGKIHSDLERGFIRAEVVRFEELSRSGSVAEARKQGVLRQEGKTYAVEEGDVVNILFNV